MITALRSFHFGRPLPSCNVSDAENRGGSSTEPELFGRKQHHAEILNMVEPRTALDFLERNQLIHSPTTDQIALAICGNAHGNGVFADLALTRQISISSK
jgi:hypothetical protein